MPVALRVMAWAAAVATLALASLWGPAARAQSVEDLQHMSVDDLTKIDVTSTTKTAQPLSDAPAAIYVITHDDIVRSGAQTVPEMLRLAPNLQVAQTSAHSWVITARGFNGNSQAQSFSDKLLVLIDGRTVYSPLFSGVYWDMQDVPAQDIDRIEVISGPGATLWGANAVNGVVNIITRSSAQIQGLTLEAGGGNLQTTATAQYGGKIGDSVTYRVYAKSFMGYDTLTAAGARDADGWTRPQAGFRVDWAASPTDKVTFQGDAYRGVDTETGGDETISGDNVMARWNHSWDGGQTLQVQTYYDRVERATEGGGRFILNTYDVDAQNSFALGARNTVVWGGGLRLERYGITPNAGLSFTPESRSLNLSNVFVQDSIALTPATTLLLGLKVEDDPYTGANVLPTARLSWKASDTTLLWGAVSRAIRAPTPFDEDVVEKSGGATFLTGDPSFDPETVTAYELGARLQPTPRLSFSVSTYYNVYNDLRTIEITPVTLIPLHWANGMRGDTYGLEAWGDYRLTSWWRLSASVNLMHENLSFKPGASGILGVAQAGDDPTSQAQLRSSMNLGRQFTFDADLRYVGALPNPRVTAYTEADSRLGWNLTDRIQFSVSGFNLLHKYHQEYPGADAVPRSVFADVRLRF
jgi:iron complex outermembrane receptor protein